MHVVVDRRPACELSDLEVVAYLFQAIRARNLRTAQQVQDACTRMFPEMAEDRQRACLGLLAEKLDDRRA